MNKDLIKLQKRFIKKHEKNVNDLLIDLDKIFKEKKIKENDIFYTLDICAKIIFNAHISCCINTISAQSLDNFNKLKSLKFYIDSTNKFIDEILNIDKFIYDDKNLN